METRRGRSNGEGRRAAGRAAALVFVAGVLALQAAAIALGAGEKLWPFLRYPMYSVAGRAEFAHRELCVSTEGRTVSTEAWDLGITSFELIRILQEVVQDTPAGAEARDFLSERVARYIAPGAGIEVWTARYEMGEEGLVDASPPWRLERAWSAPAEGEFAPPPAAALPTRPRPRATSGQCDVEDR